MNFQETTAVELAAKRASGVKAAIAAYMTACPGAEPVEWDGVTPIPQFLDELGDKCRAFEQAAYARERLEWRRKFEAVRAAHLAGNPDIDLATIRSDMEAAKKAFMSYDGDNPEAGDFDDLYDDMVVKRAAHERAGRIVAGRAKVVAYADSNPKKDPAEYVEYFVSGDDPTCAEPDTDPDAGSWPSLLKLFKVTESAGGYVRIEPIREEEPKREPEPSDVTPLDPEPAPSSPPDLPASDEAEAVPHVLDRGNPMGSALALRNARYMKGSLRMLHHYRGAFYRWGDGCYRQASPDAVRAEIWNFLHHALHETDGNLTPFKPTQSRASNVREALEAACNLDARTEAPSWLDDADMPSADEMLAVKNGLLHLPSGLIYPPTPSYFNLNCAGVAFDPDAPEPVEWLRFLDQIWPDDSQAIETLQDLFGYFLSPDTSQQKIALIVGPKRSGKGTIARILTSLLGADGVAAPTLASLATNFGLAPLIGKSLGIIGDARLSSRSDQSAIAERLLSISGEDSLTIDRKFLAAWTGRLAVRFLIMTNELPRLADASGALASRFVVLSMENSFFGKEDRGLFARLTHDLPGILNWSIEGYNRLRKRGYFLQPDSAQEALDELDALGSPIKAFIKERCIVGPGEQCSSDVLYHEWKMWCDKMGRKEPGTLQTFGRDLRAAVPGLKVVRPWSEGSRPRCYEGINYRQVM